MECKFFYAISIKRSMSKGRKEVIQFNHISKDLSEEKVEELKNLYRNYHRLTKCHKWQYKKLRKRKVILQVLGVSLTAIGGGLSAVNPLNAVIAAGGVGIYAFLGKSDLHNKVEKSKFGYQTYEKVLHQIRGILRSGEFDRTVETKLLSDLLVIDGIVTDCSPPVDKFFGKYNRKFLTTHK